MIWTLLDWALKVVLFLACWLGLGIFCTVVYVCAFPEPREARKQHAEH